MNNELIEKIRSKLLESIHYIGSDADKLNIEIANEIIDIVEQSQWVMVNDRLPDRQGKYIVYCPNGSYGKMYSAEFITVFHVGDDVVTQWHPLPSAPE